MTVYEDAESFLAALEEPTWQPPPKCNDRCNHLLGPHHERTCSLYLGRR